MIKQPLHAQAAIARLQNISDHWTF